MRLVALLALFGCTTPPAETGDTGGGDSDTDVVDTGDSDTDVPDTDDSIYDIQSGAIPSDTIVHLEKVRVTGVYRYGEYTYGIWIEEPGGGEYSGVYVNTGTTAAPPEIAVGDEVTVDGLAGEGYDSGTGETNTEIKASSGGKVTITTAGKGAPPPAVVATSTLASPDAEKWEGVLVKVEDVGVLNPKADFDWTIDDGVRVGHRLASFESGFVTAGARFASLTGVFDYYFTNFKIEPRVPEDFVGFVPADITPSTIPQLRQGEVDEGSAVVVEKVRVVAVSAYGFTVEDPAGGPYSGIYVQSYGSDVVVAIGDEVTVSGFYSESFDTSQIDVGDGTVAIVTPGKGVPAFAVVASEDLADPDLAEPWESTLVAVDDAVVADPEAGFGQWALEGGALVGSTLYAFEGGLVEAGARFDRVSGVLQYSFSSFQLQPRFAEDFVGFVPAPPRGADLLVPGDVIVTEIMFDPSVSDTCADADCEWIEVLNTTSAAIDLDRLVIDELRGSGTSIATTTIAGPLVIGPGEYGVLAASDGTGAGWTYPFSPTGTFGTFSLSNTTDASIVLSNRDGVLDSTALYDSATPSGTAWQLSGDHVDVGDNDDAANWCAAVDTIGDTTDLGTPGAANATCD